MSIRCPGCTTWSGVECGGVDGVVSVGGGVAVDVMALSEEVVCVKLGVVESHGSISACGVNASTRSWK
ncbi:unnamed protein product [Rodentolepis nana]|uniref:SRCR domain-containing protein n=1 Tax=Rodentolepis nana TaxID=102285 RepID=A0A0R3TWS1_RODNA|nr:unnamed protein product [Rodentolepis nana]